MTRRVPGSVILIGIVLFAAAAISIGVGYSLLSPDRLWLALILVARPGLSIVVEYSLQFGIAFLVLGAATAMGAIGFLRAKRWGWWIAVALFAVNGCGDIVGFFFTHDAVRSGSGLGVATIFLVALSSTTVNSYFDRAGARKLSQ